MFWSQGACALSVTIWIDLANFWFFNGKREIPVLAASQSYELEQKSNEITLFIAKYYRHKVNVY